MPFIAAPPLAAPVSAKGRRQQRRKAWPGVDRIGTTDRRAIVFGNDLEARPPGERLNGLPLPATARVNIRPAQEPRNAI
jgi:hypothetical protein